MVAQQDILFKTAGTVKEFADAKDLFNEYAASLSIDLCFQNFANELATIDKLYNKPGGALLLAYRNDVAVGCAGIRGFKNDAAELKRMYVKPDFRKHKIGFRLLELAIVIARNLNYRKIRLDTLPAMAEAQNLYRSFGFYETESYRHNPANGTIYMEKILI